MQECRDGGRGGGVRWGGWEGGGGVGGMKTDAWHCRGTQGRLGDVGGQREVGRPPGVGMEGTGRRSTGELGGGAWRVLRGGAKPGAGSQAAVAVTPARARPCAIDPGFESRLHRRSRVR